MSAPTVKGCFEVALAEPGSCDVSFSGWAFAEGGDRVDYVEVLNEAGDVERTLPGRPRSDVAAALLKPEASETGWELRVSQNRTHSRWRGVVRARAVLSGGATVDIGTKEIRPLSFAIDAPQEGEESIEGVVVTAGWALGVHSTVLGIRVVADGKSLASLDMNRARPDLTEVFPLVGPEPCGWYGVVPLPDGAVTVLDFFARFADGGEYPLGRRTVRQLDREHLTKAPWTRARLTMKAIARSTRAGEWWVHKIGFLLGVAVATAAVDGTPVAAAASAFAVLVFAGASLAAFGHVVNESFDVETDRLAGKANQMAHRSWRYRFGAMTLLLAGGWIPCLAAGVDRSALAFWAALSAMLVLYSVPPVRLKDRGWMGVVADALYGQVLPVGFVLRLVGAGVGVGSGIRAAEATVPGGAEGWWTPLVLIWAAAFGLRGILMHQLSDRDADLRSGVRTFATRTTDAFLRRVIDRGIFPVESAALITLGVVAWRTAPLAVAVVAVAVLLQAVARRTGVLKTGQWDVPLAFVYNLVVPLAFGAELARRDPVYLVFCGVFVIVFGSAIRHQLATCRRMLAARIR